MTISSSIVRVRSSYSHTTPLSETSSSVSKSLGTESAFHISPFSSSSLSSKITKLTPCPIQQLVVLHLIDCHALTLPSLYISSLLLTLRSMLQMDLPHLNVLTKVDKLSSYPSLPFNLDFYTEVQDLSYLLPHLKSENPGRLGSDKFEGLNHAISGLVQDFALVSFETLAVEDKRSMMDLLRAVDRAGGYAFGPAEGVNESVWQVAMREGAGAEMDVNDVQERWIDRKEEWDELEEKEWEEEGKWRRGQNQGDKEGKAPEPVENEKDGLGEDEVFEKTAKQLKDGGIRVMRKN